MKLFFQSLLILLSFAVVYIWQNTPLSHYTIAALGVCTFIFLLFALLRRTLNMNEMLFDDEYLIVFLVNTTLLLLIFATGVFSSPFFFLLYFLVFGIGFVLHPSTVFIFLMAAAILFVPEAVKDDVLGNFVRLGFLILISPFAFFFGRDYRNEEKKEQVKKQKSKSHAKL